MCSDGRWIPKPKGGLSACGSWIIRDFCCGRINLPLRLVGDVLPTVVSRVSSFMTACIGVEVCGDRDRGRDR